MCSGMANSFKYGICDSTKHYYQQDCETTRLLKKHYRTFLNFSVLLNIQSRNYQLIHVKEKNQTSIQIMPLRLEVCAHAFLNLALDGC